MSDVVTEAIFKALSHQTVSIEGQEHAKETKADGMSRE